ncbi:hypothetical protein Fot_28620 [Forsythia ovata]|uniref:Uncharacterized protein n=1 Tax=Forsythia ovata TaxID=205694 RepID=A0ABD1TPI4_9LAMI
MNVPGILDRGILVMIVGILSRLVSSTIYQHFSNEVKTYHEAESRLRNKYNEHFKYSRSRLISYDRWDIVSSTVDQHILNEVTTYREVESRLCNKYDECFGYSCSRLISYVRWDIVSSYLIDNRSIFLERDYDVS